MLISPIAPPVTNTNEKSAIIENSYMPTTTHDKSISTRRQGDLGSDVIRNSLSRGSVNNANS